LLVTGNIGVFRWIYSIDSRQARPRIRVTFTDAARRRRTHRAAVFKLWGVVHGIVCPGVAARCASPPLPPLLLLRRRLWECVALLRLLHPRRGSPLQAAPAGHAGCGLPEMLWRLLRTAAVGGA
jgi:hypothetical protein